LDSLLKTANFEEDDHEVPEKKRKMTRVQMPMLSHEQKKTLKKQHNNYYIEQHNMSDKQ